MQLPRPCSQHKALANGCVVIPGRLTQCPELSQQAPQVMKYSQDRMLWCNTPHVILVAVWGLWIAYSEPQIFLHPVHTKAYGVFYGAILNIVVLISYVNWNIDKHTAARLNTTCSMTWAMLICANRNNECNARQNTRVGHWLTINSFVVTFRSWEPKEKYRFW